jgi:hypothetical protein
MICVQSSRIIQPLFSSSEAMGAGRDAYGRSADSGLARKYQKLASLRF